MLESGQTVKAGELGFKGTGLYICEPCPKCQKLRWHRKSNGSYRLCAECGRKQGSLSGIDNTREWKRASELGKSLYSNLIYYKDSCYECGMELWHKRKDIGKRLCNECHKKRMSNPMAAHPMWDGGRHLRKDGYYEVTLSASDPLSCMVNKGNRLLEHRYIVAVSIGRPLESWEIVHHKNGVRTDNRIENLELLPSQMVHLSTIQSEREIRLLKLQVKALTERVGFLEDIIRQGNTEPSSQTSNLAGVRRDYGVCIPIARDDDIVRTSQKCEPNATGRLPSA